MEEIYAKDRATTANSACAADPDDQDISSNDTSSASIVNKTLATYDISSKQKDGASDVLSKRRMDMLRLMREMSEEDVMLFRQSKDVDEKCDFYN
ncbi:uncharacterized protein A4U43_C05F29730 [Asparagus officinalis]|uniref:Uncharacterized protein n=1 Tax=Asparagus officinalis TaxID=4686 RepID=A0A5P1F0V2_ASPOF|nr:uncharacterized protein A4U43_C05F29730 [Asparagus officinalis]